MKTPAHYTIWRGQIIAPPADACLRRFGRTRDVLRSRTGTVPSSQPLQCEVCAALRDVLLRTLMLRAPCGGPRVSSPRAPWAPFLNNLPRVTVLPRWEQGYGPMVINLGRLDDPARVRLATPRTLSPSCHSGNGGLPVTRASSVEIKYSCVLADVNRGNHRLYRLIFVDAWKCFSGAFESTAPLTAGTTTEHGWRRYDWRTPLVVTSGTLPKLHA